MRKVTGSSPVTSTKKRDTLWGIFFYFRSGLERRLLKTCRWQVLTASTRWNRAQRGNKDSDLRAGRAHAGEPCNIHQIKRHIRHGCVFLFFVHTEADVFFFKERFFSQTKTGEPTVLWFWIPVSLVPVWGGETHPSGRRPPVCGLVGRAGTPRRART